MLFAQAADSSTSSGSLVAYVALAASVITPLVALLNAASSRRTKRDREAANAKTEAEGSAVASGSVLEWRKTDHQALLDERTYSATTRAELITAQGEVRTLRDQLAETDRRCDALRGEFDQLVARIAACEAGHYCPVADALTRYPEHGGDK